MDTCRFVHSNCTIFNDQYDGHFRREHDAFDVFHGRNATLVKAVTRVIDKRIGHIERAMFTCNVTIVLFIEIDAIIMRTPIRNTQPFVFHYIVSL